MARALASEYDILNLTNKMSPVLPEKVMGTGPDSHLPSLAWTMGVPEKLSDEDGCCAMAYMQYRAMFEKSVGAAKVQETITLSP